jgi:hypothetical protein
MIQNESKTTSRRTTYERVYSAALELFEHDRNKLNFWWISQQPELGNIAPYEMIKAGKGRKLLRIIERCKG